MRDIPLESRSVPELLLAPGGSLDILISCVLHDKMETWLPTQIIREDI
jgi:hypothetical protein